MGNRIEDVSYLGTGQGILGKLFGTGDVSVSTAGTMGVRGLTNMMVFRGIPNHAEIAHAVRDRLRE